MKSNKKIWTLVITIIFTLVAIMPNNLSIKIVPCEEHHITIEIISIEMIDFIDEDFMGNENKKADFTCFIWVDGEKHTFKAPDDRDYVSGKELSDGGKYTWTVQKMKVRIKIKLIDRDLVSDDTCDINGYSIDKYSVEFDYDLKELNHRFGYDYCGFFDGTFRIDDDDASITICYEDDYYPPEPKLSVTPVELEWNLEFGRFEDTVIPPKQIEIKNIGDPSTTLKWEVSGKDDWYKISPRSGELRGGERITVNIDPHDKLYNYEDTFHVKSNGGKQDVSLKCKAKRKARTIQYEKIPITINILPRLIEQLIKNKYLIYQIFQK